MDDDSSQEDVPPPIEGAESADKGAGSIADSIPLEAPSTAGVGLSQGTLAESDERTMSLLAHILGGVTCVVGPLVIWMLKKDESPFVDDQGKEAVNFQITMLIGYVITGAILGIPCIGALLWAAVVVTSLIFAILGGLEANKGVAYRYPFALRLIK